MRSAEVRLGLVMYGGVSLAIYENGVAQELFRASKGEGVYELLQAIADVDVVVDVISGASAGGINGILLGYALANGKDFRGCSQLWLDNGDLLDLLRHPEDPSTLSVLDSEKYQAALEKAFTGMEAYGAPSESEIDVFVTGTDVAGRVFTVLDDQGHAIDVKDHRALFLLSYREGRKNEFAPENATALAKLARITSCFPVAFAPVHVSDPDDVNSIPEPGEREVDRLLRRWGRLAPGDVHFLDGGILDNKPFSYTIDAIFSRLADRDVLRTLLYVEPDPERFERRDGARPAAAPNALQAASNALIGIPGYESIAGDLQSIAERNSRLARQKELLDQLEPLPLLDDFVDGRTPDDLGLLAKQDEQRVRMYRRARLSQLRDRAIQGVLKDGGHLQLRSGSRRTAAEILVDGFTRWKGDGNDTLRSFDVYYRLRRLYYVVYQSMDRAYASSNPPSEGDLAKYRDLFRRLNHQIKVLEMLRFALESTLDKFDFRIDELGAPGANAGLVEEKWRAVQSVMQYVLAAPIPLPSAGIKDWQGRSDAERAREEKEQRRKFMGDDLTGLRRHLRDLQKDVPSTPASARNLLLETDAQEREILRRLNPTHPSRLDYCKFMLVDSYVFPMERLGGIEAKDVIRTVRVSPIDARRGVGDLSLDDKLCGNMVGHFGGFLKRSWRANDIMWGRLDGVCQLIELLVTPERIGNLRTPFARRRAGLSLAALFPSTSPEDRAKLEQGLAHLEDLAKAALRPGHGKDDSSEFATFRNLLIHAAQREILEVEVPKVISSSIQQQTSWNQYGVEQPGAAGNEGAAGSPSAPADAPFDLSNQAWKTGVDHINPTILAAASSYLVDHPANATPGFWTAFFEAGKYKVGAEKVQDGVPTPILVEVASRAALALRNCLLGTLGESQREKIRTNGLFRFGVDYPLRAIQGLLQFQRTNPEYSKGALTALNVACVAFLAGGILWWKDLMHGSNEPHPVRFLLLIVVPIVTLLFEMLVFAKTELVARVLALSAAGVFSLLLAMFGRVIGPAQIQQFFAWAPFLADPLLWLWAHHMAIVSGAITALVLTLPARALWQAATGAPPSPSTPSTLPGAAPSDRRLAR